MLINVDPKTAINIMQPTQPQQIVIYRHRVGPMIALNIESGLALNCIRPTGGGRYGFILGASRPLPTGFDFASVSGTI